MNGRKVEVSGNINPARAYSLIESARTALNVGALGLGVTNQISPKSSLYSVVTVEGFSAILGLIVFMHEFIKLLKNRSEYSVGHSIYVIFRLSAILAGIAGLSLISADLASGKTDGNNTTIGTILIALGIFCSRSLTSSIPVNKKTKTENDTNLHAQITSRPATQVQL